MAVYLSPGVFTREIDLSVLPNATGPLRPAFIGVANKGPMNTATLITNPQQAIDTFGAPFPSSYLMYAVLAFLEEGNQCYVMRVGVECEPGQVAALSSVCVDTSGGRGAGWGRIPIFTGIDFGRINLALISATAPLTFHASSITNLTYNDATPAGSNGPTVAAIQTLGTYTGSVSDSYVLVVTNGPNLSDHSKVAGATYQVVRNSDGVIVASGTFVDQGATGTSDWIPIGSGLSVRVVVTSGTLSTNDTFSFDVTPDNRVFQISVDGGTANSYTMPTATYTTVASFITAFNALLVSEKYLMGQATLADGTIIPQLQTTVAGRRIQIMGTQGWALAVGQQQYAYDIPRSHLLALDTGPFTITVANNRVSMNVIGAASTQLIEFNVPVGTNQSTATIAAAIDAAGTGLFNSYVLTIPGGTQHVAIETDPAVQLDTLQMLADYAHIRTLRFAELLDIPFPQQLGYRGFTDNRTVLPDSGQVTASNPLSCETSPTSAACIADSAYFQNIVGWLVAPTPGTWLTGYTATLQLFTGGVGDAAGRYTLTINDPSNVPVDVIQDVSFDPRVDRYIANVINPGTKFGGTSGDSFVNWEDRPAYLDNDTTLSTFTVRLPSQFSGIAFAGMADGVPIDPVYSSELDAAVIGNPATATGIFAFQNPETFDINLLCTPGFSSGAVIGTGLQMCEARGDVLYIVDPPFGLRPQQVVNWHNGMLLSDLTAAIDSSYGALYWGWVKIFDQFSSNEIWIPPSGHVSAVFSRTARDAEQWFAPAGLRRGHLLTALDVEYSPTQGERDLLYGSGNAVNPIVKFPQDGITIWGQRTLQRQSTALDRVSVRMLLTYIKKNLVRTLRNYIFEPNDSILWRQVTATVEPFLADVQARRGLTGYKVVCDSTNNTPERQDRNELWVSVFLQPTKAVEFIVLNLVVLRTGASFSAEEVLAAGGIITTAA